MKDKRKTNQQLANSLVMVLQFGINVLVPILLCMFIGKLITDKTGESAFTIIGILLGIVAAFNGAYRSVRGYLQNEESPGQRARRIEEESSQKKDTDNND